MLYPLAQAGNGILTFRYNYAPYITVVTECAIARKINEYSVSQFSCKLFRVYQRRYSIVLTMLSSIYRAYYVTQISRMLRRTCDHYSHYFIKELRINCMLCQ